MSFIGGNMPKAWELLSREIGYTCKWLFWENSCKCSPRSTIITIMTLVNNSKILTILSHMLSFNWTFPVKAISLSPALSAANENITKTTWIKRESLFCSVDWDAWLIFYFISSEVPTFVLFLWKIPAHLLDIQTAFSAIDGAAYQWNSLVTTET